MGSKKSSILERIKEGDQIGREAVDAGEKLEGDGSEIKAILDSIDTSMDEDDVAGIQKAESGYDTDIKSAFSEEVETKESDVERIEGEASDSSTAELDKVTDAADKLNEAAGVTDVGRRNAEGAADQMRTSAGEYEEFVSDSISIVEETKSEVDALKGSIENIFG